MTTHVAQRFFARLPLRALQPEDLETIRLLFPRLVAESVAIETLTVQEVLAVAFILSRTRGEIAHLEAAPAENFRGAVEAFAAQFTESDAAHLFRDICSCGICSNAASARLVGTDFSKSRNHQLPSA